AGPSRRSRRPASTTTASARPGESVDGQTKRTPVAISHASASMAGGRRIRRRRRPETVPSAAVTAVLFTCAGQRVDIVSAFGQAGARTIAADEAELAPALYHADERELVPRVDDRSYVPTLAQLVRTYDVQLIVPLTDL